MDYKEKPQIIDDYLRFTSAREERLELSFYSLFAL